VTATGFGLAALILWAFLALLSTLAAGLPPFQLTAMSFAVGAAFGLAFLQARGAWGALRQPPLAWVHGVGGLFGYHALYFAALAYAPAIEANLLNYLWPLLIVVFSAPILGLRLGARRLCGVAFGFAGCAVLLGGGAGFPAEAWFGFLCALGCALVWSLYSVTSRRFTSVPTEAVAGFCAASACLALLAHLALEPSVMPDARQAMAVLLLGLGPMGAAFFLWDRGMKQGDPRLLGTLAYGVPVASTLLLIAVGEGVFTWNLALAVAAVAGGGWLAATAR